MRRGKKGKLGGAWAEGLPCGAPFFQGLSEDLCEGHFGKATGHFSMLYWVKLTLVSTHGHFRADLWTCRGEKAQSIQESPLHWDPQRWADGGSTGQPGDY